jgi:hypothetical protein
MDSGVSIDLGELHHVAIYPFLFHSLRVVHLCIEITFATQKFQFKTQYDPDKALKAAYG